MPKILVVDDEKSIVELIRFNLAKEKWDIEIALDGRTAIELAKQILPDVIILDIMLPEIDGLEVCRRLKANEKTEAIPIIMLSAKGEELDRILGLEIGADDYMVKPFSPRELIARIKARLRIKYQVKEQVPEDIKEIKVGQLIINPQKFEVSLNGVKKILTLKEFELLKLLAANRGRVFTREFLLNSVWGYDYLEETRTVDVHVRHLRQKIEEDPDNPKLIETVRGVGYRFRDV